MWHNTCWGSFYTDITGNVFIDLILLMAIGLFLLWLSASPLYSDFKEWRKSENKVKWLLEEIPFMLGSILYKLGGFLLGFVLFLVCFIDLILLLFIC